MTVLRMKKKFDLGRAARIGLALGIVGVGLLLSGVRSVRAQTSSDCLPRWEVVPSPNVGDGANRLTGVAALAPDNAWAVGVAYEDGYPYTLILHWDGTVWTVAYSAAGGVAFPEIVAIYEDDIWVGAGYPLHWDGTRWTPSPQYTGLESLSAVASDNVWGLDGANRVWHWDGTTWTEMPRPGGPYDRLLDIAAFGANDIWAVGMVQIHSVLTETQAWHWDGRSWQLQPLRDSGMRLYAVAGWASNDVWAVGEGGTRPVAEHWDGRTWKSVDTREVPWSNSFTALEGLAILAPNNIWAVGHGQGSGATENLVEQWNGTRWRLIPTPRIGNSGLADVAALSPHDIWAVGTAGDQRTFILHAGKLCQKPGTPVQLIPADEARVDVPVVLDWRKVKGASVYEVQVWRNDEPGQTLVDARTSKSTYTVESLIGTRAGFAWRVRACNDQACSPWSATRHFATAPIP